jgi:hypothetical protein
MRHMVVLYVREDEGVVPQAFTCQADDPDHAEEQCLNAYPGVDVVWVHIGEWVETDIERITNAFREYWTA